MSRLSAKDAILHSHLCPSRDPDNTIVIESPAPLTRRSPPCWRENFLTLASHPAMSPRSFSPPAARAAASLSPYLVMRKLKRAPLTASWPHATTSVLRFGSVWGSVTYPSSPLQST